MRLEASLITENRVAKLELGKLYQARSAEKIPGAQDGGVVTALLGYSLDEHIIKAAVVLGRDNRWNAFPTIVTESRELEKYTGSIYFPVSYKEHRRVIRKALDDYGDVGAVFTPCELRVLGTGSNAVRPGDVFLKIGLFCLGTFVPEKFWSYVNQGINREDIKRFEVNRHLRLIDEDGDVVFRAPIKESHNYSIPWCKKCREFLPAGADLSVGAGPEKGTCAVYLQTERGLEIFDRALQDGKLTVAEVSDKFRETTEKIMHKKRKNS